MNHHIKSLSPVAIFTILVLIGVVLIVGLNLSSFLKTAPAKSAKTEKLDADIATGEKQVAAKPTTTKPYIGLASLYLQKVRETSDATYYKKIDTLMDEAAALDPKEGDVPAIRSSVAMGRHDFRNGKLFITQALALNATVPAYYGLMGDADIELGQYKEAVAAFQKMVDLRPDFSSWSRIAYIRELYGDIPGAESALRQAISAGSNYPENIAWAYVELGKLQMRTDLPEATKSFNLALLTLPTYTQAMEGLGKVAFFKGDLSLSEKEFTDASNGLALAQYFADLGDLYTYEKNPSKAAQEYALAQAAFATSIQGGVNTDLEESLFLSDHDLSLPQALTMATRAYTDRPSEYGADYYAWALYKSGQVAKAATYADQAFVLGKFDPVILFHQGMIALANKDTVHAKEYLTKAKAISPNLSIHYQDMLASALASSTVSSR